MTNVDKLIFFVVISAVLLCIALPAAALDYGPAYVHWTEPGTTKAFDWAAVEGADTYEIYIFNMERTQSYLVGKMTAAPTISIRFRTHGTYVLYARAGMTRDGQMVWGEWRNSLDPSCGVVGGRAQPWVIYVPLR